MLRRTLDRYVLREVLGPVALGFLVYTFILLINFLFRSAELIIRRDVPSTQVLQLLLYTLPNIVVLTLPMAFLFGCLVGVGRLAADSELVAIRASGISLFSLYRPILALSLVIAAGNSLLMLEALPRGNHALQRLRLQILARSMTQQVEPRVFYDGWEGLMLYVFEAVPEEKRWRGVFVAPDLPNTENEVIVADSGRVHLDPETDRLILHLQNAVTHKVDFRDPDKYQIGRHRKLLRVLEDSFSAQQQLKVSASKGLRELTISELRANLRKRELPPDLRRLTRVEIHKKFSIPAASVVFGLLALPLGFAAQRGGGRSSGFALSIGVILVYYILITNGEEAARVGKLPAWLAIWGPNLVLGAGGLFLLIRRNADKSLLLGSFHGWLRRGLGRRRRERALSREAAPAAGRSAREPAARGRPGVVLRLPRLTIPFPNLLDRYVIRLFLWVFLLVLLSLVAVFLIADITDSLDSIVEHDVSTEVVVDYYKYFSLQVAYDIAPIAVLLTTLIAFGILSRSNEVVAAKALGVSLYRLALPAAVAALGVTLFSLALETAVLPAANQKITRLKDTINGRTSARTYRRADRQWLFGQGRYIYNYLRYDRDSKTLDRLQVFEFGERDYDLERRLYAANAQFMGEAWLFTEGWVRSFDKARVLGYEGFSEPVLDYYPETPDYFESELKPPEAMSYGELRDYVAEIEASGQKVPLLRVELHKKIAFPVVCLIMALIALPFSFRLGRRGALYGVGQGLALGMVFFGVLALFSTLGEAGALPAALAVWSPNIAFALCSVYLFLGIRT